MSKKEYEGRETNQSRRDDSSNHFLLGAIVGGVVGAATALLLAPKAGKELRNTLTGQAGNLLEKTEPLREKTISLSQGIAKQSTGLFNKGKEKQGEEDSDTAYISLESPQNISTPSKTSGKSTLNSEELRKKLAETQRALEEEESKVKL
ncbi:YtxH domain-containing protein [Neobacillus sp. LXY-1]|uniref:YtxH domain-containing protein n=1 Tax=Neobacillus sp. LXY-1 TaxID=3379133 RepID=UPI003EDFB872